MNKQKITAFLIKNGFEKQEPNSYANSMCNVVIGKYRSCIVADNNGNQYFATNFYEALGFMVMMEFITEVKI